MLPIDGTFNQHLGNNMQILEGDIMVEKFVFFFVSKKIISSTLFTKKICYD